MSNETPKVGDKILLSGGQIAEITVYDTIANNMTYVIKDGHGTNYISAHISNTAFTLLHVAAERDPLTAALVDALDTEKSSDLFIHDPVEEDADTDRVKQNPEDESGDEITTAGDSGLVADMDGEDA